MYNAQLFYASDYSGLKNNLKEDPAGHPERNTYRLVPLPIPVASRRTVPLSSWLKDRQTKIADKEESKTNRK
jgi:hypothetical protein